MIDVTVKTLDAQNHRFSVPDEITVQQFKARISSSVHISAEKQRLIFCGRVLQDDKKLAEYGVHERVIHLVARTPPGPRSSSAGPGDSTASSSQSAPQNNNLHGPPEHFVVTDVLGQHLEFIEFPGGPNGTPSSSAARLNHVRTILNRADSIISALDARARQRTPNDSSDAGDDGSLRRKRSRDETEEEDMPNRANAEVGSFSARPLSSAVPVSADTVSSSSTGAAAPPPCTAASSSPDGAAFLSSTDATASSSTGAAASSSTCATASSITNASTSNSLSAQELDVIYREMDSLIQMPPVPVGIPSMGRSGLSVVNSINTAAGLAQAASAAIVSAMASPGLGGQDQIPTPLVSLSSSSTDRRADVRRRLLAARLAEISAERESRSDGVPQPSGPTSQPAEPAPQPSGPAPQPSGPAPQPSGTASQSSGLDSQSTGPRGPIGSQESRPQGPQSFQSGVRISSIDFDGGRIPMMMGHSGPTAITLRINAPSVERVSAGPAHVRVRISNRERSADERRADNSNPAATARSRSADGRRPQLSGRFESLGGRREGSGPGANESAGGGGDHPRTSVMARLLRSYREAHRRLEPHIERYIQIMETDPPYSNSVNQTSGSSTADSSGTAVQNQETEGQAAASATPPLTTSPETLASSHEDQWLIWRVSEAMHILSHIQHGISDILVDLRTPPPRQLRARPIIIHQPTVLQFPAPDTPMDDTVTVSSTTTTTTSSTSATTSATSDTTTTSSSETLTPPSAAATASFASSLSDAMASMISGGAVGLGSGNEQQNDFVTIAGQDVQQMLNLSNTLGNSLDQAVVLMQVEPSIVNIGSDIVGDGNGTGAANLVELMTSFTTELAGHLSGEAPAPPSSPAPSAAGAGTTPPATHNSQAGRNSGGTSTTNATQTRVTPRPQVHLTPLNVPGLGMNQFDPFLSCHSHFCETPVVNSPRRGSQPRPVGVGVRTGHVNFRPGNRMSSGGATAASRSPPAGRRREGPPTSQSTADNFDQNLIAELLSIVMRHAIPPGGRQSAAPASRSSTSTTFSFSSSSNRTEPRPAAANAGQAPTSEPPSEQPATVPTPAASAAMPDELDLSRRLERILDEFQRLLPPTEEAGGNAANMLQSALPAMRLLQQQALRGGGVQFTDLVQEVLEALTSLRQFVLNDMLDGRDPTPANVSASIEDIIRSMQGPIRDVVSQALSRQALECVHTINSFLRHRLRDLVTIIVHSGSSSEALQSLLTTVMASLTEFNMLCRHFLPADQDAFAQVISSTVGHLLDFVYPGNHGLAGVGEQTIRLLLDIMRQHTPTDLINRYIVNVDTANRMEEELYQGYENLRLSTPPDNESQEEASSDPSVEMVDTDIDLTPGVDSDAAVVSGIENGSEEDMDVVMISDVEAVVGDVALLAGEAASGLPNGSPQAAAVTADARPPWHSAIPQEWLPVITQDVERQRGQGGNRPPSDAYICGAPYKRRRLTTQNKPRGTVGSVMQDTMRSSLRAAGISNVAVLDAVNSDAEPNVTSAFTAHMRSALRRAASQNPDCASQRFSNIKDKL